MDSTDAWMRRCSSLARLAGLASLLIVAVGCGDADDGDEDASSTGPDASSKKGAFGYPCYDDGTCDPGWVCRSGTCFTGSLDADAPDAGDARETDTVPDAREDDVRDVMPDARGMEAGVDADATTPSENDAGAGDAGATSDTRTSYDTGVGDAGVPSDGVSPDDGGPPPADVPEPDGTPRPDGRIPPRDVPKRADTDGGQTPQWPDVPGGPNDTDSDTDAASSPIGQLKPKYENSFSRSCGGASSPARCQTTPSSFGNWGPASVVTDLDVVSSAAQSCCVDFDTDNESGPGIDNAYGGFFDAFSSQFNVDSALQRAIDRGDLLLTFEHAGLSGLNNSNAFDVHTYTASKVQSGASLSPGVDLEVDSASLDAGVYPKHSFGPAQLQGGRMSGGPGEARLSPRGRLLGSSGGSFVAAMLFNGPPLRGAVVRGDVVASSSSLGDRGVTIQNGELAGYRTVRDIFRGFNRAASNCGCLGNPDPQTNPVFQLAYRSSSDPDLCPPSNPNCSTPVTCNQTLVQRSNNRCSSSQDPGICSSVATFCSIGFGSILISQADLDTDGDGYVDALSFGARFEATGAEITGVSTSP